MLELRNKRSCGNVEVVWAFGQIKRRGGRKPFSPNFFAFFKLQFFLSLIAKK